MRLILGYRTGEQHPQLLTTDGPVSLAPNADLRIELSATRHCVGFDPPDGSGHQACPTSAPAAQGSQCLGCLDASHTRACVRCIGRFCNNPQRRDKCLFTDHYVYLAYYTDNLVKVGVTRTDRFAQRIREQGALGALAIAGAGGQEVRRIEHDIAEAEWRDRTNIIPLLTIPFPSQADVKASLAREAQRVAERLPHLPIAPGVDVWLAPEYPTPLEFPPRMLDVRNDPMSGTVQGTRGNYLLLQNGHETVLCSLRGLVGRSIVTTTTERAGIAQGSLF